MRQTLEAIFEDGVFKPLGPASVPDGQHVRIEFDVEPCPSPDELLRLAASVYAGLPPDEIRQVESAAQRRTSFFDRSGPSSRSADGVRSCQ